MIDDYLLPVEGIDTERLLADWRWLIGGKTYSLRAIAAIGNLFLEDQDGHIFILDIEEGSFARIAQSPGQFAEMLGDRHNRKAWLQTFLVRELRRLGILLGPGQCYGSKTPLILQSDSDEGSLEEDIEPTDLTVHVSMLGQIHRQVKDIPPGTTIDDIRIEPPPEL